jgi:hypothetical protein
MVTENDSLTGVIGGERWLTIASSVPSPDLSLLDSLEMRSQLFSTGRDALYAIAAEIAPPTVYLPDFVCESLPLAVSTAGAPVEFFPLAEDLRIGEATWAQWKPGDLAVIPHYFGVNNYDAVVKLRARGILTVSDVTHCMLDPELMNNLLARSDYVFGSFRKQIRTPDGAFVGTQSQKLPQTTNRLRLDFVSHRTAGLVTRGLPAEGELVGASSLAFFESAEAALEAEAPGIFGISELGFRALNSFDYVAERVVIAANTKGVLSNLPVGVASPTPLSSRSPFVLLRLPSTTVALRIREALARDKIFLPQHWPGVNLRSSGHFSDRSLSVPVDSRYSPEQLASMFEHHAWSLA